MIKPPRQKRVSPAIAFEPEIANDERGSMKNQSSANALRTVARTPGRKPPKRLAAKIASKKVR
jgi:hypothetical protein